MKIPITDQFLWMIYEILETGKEILEPPTLLKVRGFRNIVPLGDDYWKKIEEKKRRKQFSQFINYLKRRGYIEIANLKQKEGVLLTRKGKEKALMTKFKLTKKKKRKDGKWIMVMYDIPEYKRQMRDLLRGMLLNLGFQEFQKSIWVSPYEVYKELEKGIRIHEIDQYVRIFLIKEI